MTSCSVKSDYQFKDSTDALKQYRDFHHRIVEEHQANAERLSDFICQWQELSDTVFNYIKKDPAFTAHTYLSLSFHKLQIPSVLNFYDWLLDVTFLM